MGHARTYLGFDIIRRILSDYFNYDVTLVMNITDLDDKIIERANEQKITCTELSRRFEAEFHQDMVDLGVGTPDILTRVTEYMPQIVTFIQEIIDKGFAYESNGSVYFNTSAFNENECHTYCKLEPENMNNEQLIAEGEGKLTSNQGDKKNYRDFALWKKSKEHEPSWESPWGLGRPGWHIECSVMASDVFTKLSGSDPSIATTERSKMDIHSGGVDLKFPHHDNELAQSEAQCGCSQWVNYFVHSGHLHIKGFKMSKSLKNFITIQQALEQNTARQIRMCFLLHKYNAPMDYGDNTMQHAVEREKFFTEFFHNVKAALRATPITNSQFTDERSVGLQLEFIAIKQKVDSALKDDFDTPTAMHTLADLVRAVNKYMENNTNMVSLLIRGTAMYVTKMFRVFGLISESGSEIGWSLSNNSGSTGAVSSEEVLTPMLDALMTFRSNVRDRAREKDISAVMKECDIFRDDVLPELGVRLEDKTTGSVWKLADPQELMKEREMKELEKKRKAEEKALAKAAKEKKDALNKMPPIEYMKSLTIDDASDTPKYSKFNEETGLPTHLHTGEELNKNQAKKALKEFNAQKKKYEKYLSTQG